MHDEESENAEALLEAFERVGSLLVALDEGPVAENDEEESADELTVSIGAPWELFVQVLRGWPTTAQVELAERVDDPAVRDALAALAEPTAIERWSAIDPSPIIVLGRIEEALLEAKTLGD
ncbi:MAG: hypothetical protein AAGA56_02200 [Myxococcota bacterium]